MMISSTNIDCILKVRTKLFGTYPNIQIKLKVIFNFGKTTQKQVNKEIIIRMEKF